jgi:phthalate 4,5-dioxygenase
MLTREENETLCRVGPNTAMGRVMRRYWHPVCTSEQLPHPDCDPLRVNLLGERFVAFRDSAGEVGVLDELCMHRGASLALCRVEGGGLRCLYHGWKFAVDGTILETPNHADCRFRERLKAPATHPRRGRHRLDLRRRKEESAAFSPLQLHGRRSAEPHGPAD